MYQLQLNKKLFIVFLNYIKSQSDIEQTCVFYDFLWSLLVKERMNSICCLEDGHFFKLQTLYFVTMQTNAYSVIYNFMNEYWSYSRTKFIIVFPLGYYH